MSPKTELLSGTCQHFLFSPKGAIEGLLLQTKGKTIQVSIRPEVGTSLANKTGPGKRLRLLATLDKSPKAADGDHPVYEFEALTDRTGTALPPLDGLTQMKGVVARIHYAKHGQPNGVVLETGEFVHLRPHGMAAIGLVIGAKLTDKGELRTTVLGTRMLKAHHANG